MKLLLVLIRLVKEAFALSLPQAMYEPYHIGCGKFAFAPFSENNIPRVSLCTTFLSIHQECVS